MKRHQANKKHYPDDMVPHLPKSDKLSKKEQKLLDAISASEGATSVDLTERLGWTRGTVRYHRDKLVRRGLVYCDRLSHPHQHYTVSHKNGHKPKNEFHEVRLNGFLTNKKRAQVVECLEQAHDSPRRPGGWMTPNAVATQLGASHEFVVRTANRLEELGAVERRSAGFRTEIRITPEELSTNGHAVQEPGSRDPARK